MAAFEDAVAWAAELERLGARIAPRFGRVEPRRRALAYLRGLLAPIERKNGWQLAEAAGDATPDGMQDFLGRMRWDADRVRDDLRAYVVEHLGDPGAVLVLDETGFVKKGTHSVGVQRQYSGTAGRIENCQIGVFLAYASAKGQALIDRALYLPERWAGDAERCARAGVPDEVAFATMIGQADHPVPQGSAPAGRCRRAQARRGHADAGAGGGRAVRPSAAGGSRFCEDGSAKGRWVTGDSVYGSDHRLRRLIERHGRGYVLAVTGAQRLGLKPVEDWLEDVPAKAWRRLSAGEGAKGPRFYDWVYLPYRSLVAEGWKTGLLIRRSLKEPGKLAFYLTLAPAATSLEALVRVAGMRWTVEACFEAAKGEVGLDQYEVRSPRASPDARACGDGAGACRAGWAGWHRHVTLSMLAHAYLAVVRQTAIGGIGDGRPRRRPAAPHRAGGTPPGVVAGVGTTARSRAGGRLVALAPPPPAARPPLPLATTNRS